MLGEKKKLAFFYWTPKFMSSYLNFNRYTIKRKTYIAAVENKYTYIVLLNNLGTLGEKGDIVKVRRGSARNLIKNRKAVYAIYENIDSFANKEKYKRSEKVDIKKIFLKREDFEKYFFSIKNIDLTIYLETYKYTNKVSYNLYEFFNYISNKCELDLSYKNLHKIYYYKNNQDYENDKKLEVYSDLNDLNDLLLNNNSIFNFTGIYVIHYYIFLPNINFLNELIFRIQSLQEYELLKEAQSKKTEVVYSLAH